MRDDIQRIIDQNLDLADAAAAILSGPRHLAIYCIRLGLEQLQNRRRAIRRRELRAVVQPEFTKASGAITGRVVFTKRAQKRIIDNARELFDGWMINATISLGEATKEDLILQAVAEENSATGHIRNAQFYRALAAPLGDGQKAASYWTPKRVRDLRSKMDRRGDDDRPAP
jgi:hypothetical protein